MEKTAVGTTLGQTQVSNQTQGQTAEKEFSYKKLAVMWGLIFIGYFLFVVQWYSISNFAGGWGAAFFLDGKQNELVASVPNWMITLGRSIGSVLAGYWIAKLGHKYAVCFVLALMVISFPFIIVAQNAEWNSLSIAGESSTVGDSSGRTAVAGFSLFVIFRIFLAIGGTTLISYTNSVIAKMPVEKKVGHMTLNQFAFNGGAFVANIFFVIPGASDIVSKPAVWTGILSAFVVLVAVILVCYFFIADEVVPKQIKTQTFNEKNKYGLANAFKDKEAWPLYAIYIIWLVSVVFVNSGTMRNFIERSPVNTVFLIQDNINHGLYNTSAAISIAKSNSYFWVWPAYICMFVLGFIVSIFTITKFSKTVFKRKWYIAIVFGLGYLFLFGSILIGYFGGYGNPVALAFYLIFSFMSGIFLWGVQPVIFTIPQQQEKSNPQYVGVLAGVIWGVGYFGYTIVDASLSSIVTYVDTQNYASLVQTHSVQNGGSLDPYTIKPNEAGGYITMIVLLTIILCSVFVICKFLPDSGYRKDGVFHKFDKNWNPLNFKHYNFTSKEYLISNQ